MSGITTEYTSDYITAESIAPFTGVICCSNAYYAIIKVTETHTRAIGPFATPALAADAYDVEIIKLDARNLLDINTYSLNRDKVAHNDKLYVKNEDDNFIKKMAGNIKPVQPYIGVVQTSSGYIALIKCHIKTISIGPFQQATDAAVAHDFEVAELIREGEPLMFKPTNFPICIENDQDYVPSTFDQANLEELFGYKYLPNYTEPKVPQLVFSQQLSHKKIDPPPRTLRPPPDPATLDYARSYSGMLKHYGRTSVWNGVSNTVNGWRAICEIDGAKYHLGLFSKELQAAEAYDTFVHELYTDVQKKNDVVALRKFYNFFTNQKYKCNLRPLEPPEAIINATQIANTRLSVYEPPHIPANLEAPGPKVTVAKTKRMLPTPSFQI